MFGFRTYIFLALYGIAVVTHADPTHRRERGSASRGSYDGNSGPKTYQPVDVQLFSETVSRARAQFRPGVNPAQLGLSPRVADLMTLPTLRLLEEKPREGSEEDRFTLEGVKRSRLQDLQTQIGIRDGRPEVLRMFDGERTAELGKLMADMMSRRMDLTGQMYGRDGDHKLKAKMQALWDYGQRLIASGQKPRDAFEAALIEGVKQGMENRQKFWNTVDQVLKDGDVTKLGGWSEQFPAYLQALQLTDRSGGPAGDPPQLKIWFDEAKTKMQQLFGVSNLQSIDFKNPFPQMQKAMEFRRQLAQSQTPGNEGSGGNEPDPQVVNTGSSQGE